MTDPDVVAGRYRVVRSLGAGGMGRVWLARDEILHRDVAIKEVHVPPQGSDEHGELRDRTLREARAAARLSHPSVVRVFNIESDGERDWIVMEYVRSRSLLEVLREAGALPVDDVVEIGLAVLSALAAANKAGVLHRDVKPSNVLIAEDGRVVLTDFGSASLDENAGAITRSGVIVGTPQYIAPERAETGIATPESDLWSLGATLYHAVEGRGPYARTTIMETLSALANEKPHGMTRAGPLAPVIRGLLRKDPRARMTAAEVERRLTTLASARTVRLRPAVRPGWRPRQWHWLTAGAAAAVLAVGLIAVNTDGTRSGGGGAGAEIEDARSPVGAAAPSPRDIPAGFRWWYDPNGVQIAYPAGWEMLRETSDAMLFRAPDDPRTLRVSADSAAAERATARLPGYRRVDRGYVFDGADGPMRGLDTVVTARGTTYLIQWRTPRDAWQANLPKLTVITESFRPPDG